MAVKIFSGLIAMALMIGFCAVAVIKLKDIPLTIVTLIGIGMMAWDLWDSLKEQDD
jgi:hypothetical protein